MSNHLTIPHAHLSARDIASLIILYSMLSEVSMPNEPLPRELPKATLQISYTHPVMTGTRAYEYQIIRRRYSPNMSQSALVTNKVTNNNQQMTINLPRTKSLAT